MSGSSARAGDETTHRLVEIEVVGCGDDAQRAGLGLLGGEHAREVRTLLSARFGVSDELRRGRLGVVPNDERRAGGGRDLRAADGVSACLSNDQLGSARGELTQGRVDGLVAGAVGDFSCGALVLGNRGGSLDRTLVPALVVRGLRRCNREAGDPGALIAARIRRRRCRIPSPAVRTQAQQALRGRVAFSTNYRACRSSLQIELLPPGGGLHRAHGTLFVDSWQPTLVSQSASRPEARSMTDSETRLRAPATPTARHKPAVWSTSGSHSRSGPRA